MEHQEPGQTARTFSMQFRNQRIRPFQHRSFPRKTSEPLASSRLRQKSREPCYQCLACILGSVSVQETGSYSPFGSLFTTSAGNDAWSFSSSTQASSTRSASISSDPWNSTGSIFSHPTSELRKKFLLYVEACNECVGPIACCAP